MVKTDFMNSVSRSFHKVGFTLKKHSPEIMVVVGVVGAVASAVMACKATTKVQKVMEETKEQLDAVKEATEQGCIPVPSEIDETAVEMVEYTAEDSKKDKTIIYVQTGVKLAKLYGPSIILGGLSIASILAGHNILRKRNFALAAAYTAIDKSFKDYRGRVVDRFGKELDRELRYNIKTKEVETTVVDEEGNETTVTKTITYADPSKYSIYSVIFDEGNVNWTKQNELNKLFLIQQQQYANDRLKTRGMVSLNEVYEALGFQKTAYGQIAGWVWSEDGSAGDNFIDFGMFDLDNPKARDFINGDERSIVLDFNCIGNMLDYL